MGSQGNRAASQERTPVEGSRVTSRALLLQADISGARPLLENAVERGSARAALYAGRDLRRPSAAIVARTRNPPAISRRHELYERT
jgi:hypothetical protein